MGGGLRTVTVKKKERLVVVKRKKGNREAGTRRTVSRKEDRSERGWKKNKVDMFWEGRNELRDL